MYYEEIANLTNLFGFMYVLFALYDVVWMPGINVELCVNEIMCKVIRKRVRLSESLVMNSLDLCEYT